jgi:poly(3-hydroxybutyrate) depolymerase
MIRRRELLMAGVALAGCDRKRHDESGASAAAPRDTGDRWTELSFPPSANYGEPEMAALLAVREAPILVALHGRGEAGRGLEAGARGWRDDYQLDRAHQRLHAPPLTRDDFHGFVDAERLARLNASLRVAPYRGLAVACPYAPALADRSAKGAGPFARFVTKELLPRVRAQLGATPDRARTGIDGVSMGGRLALLVGLSHPDVFASVGALQPAIGTADAPWLADMAKKAGVTLRLVSSHDDPFLEAVQALSRALDERAVAHQLTVTPGPHDYVWNRGPGSYEMLMWHERVLRGLGPP